MILICYNCALENWAAHAFDPLFKLIYFRPASLFDKLAFMISIVSFLWGGVAKETKLESPNYLVENIGEVVRANPTGSLYLETFESSIIL